MRKVYLLMATAVLCVAALLLVPQIKNLESFSEENEEMEEKEEYDGAMERDLLEFEKTKDPSLGYVPFERLGEAMEYAADQKRVGISSRTSAALSWEERGPIYDTVGPSNGNSRAGFNYTSGRIRAVLIDTLNDPTGNTVIAGGVAGGLWKCTNFLDEIPNWQVVNDYFANLAISSLAQDKSNAKIMYFTTGEASSNADAVLGKGVWKSTDGGATWTQLPSTRFFLRSFKILTDDAGNVYLATRSLTTPIEQPYGLLRSSDGGATWQNITPANLTSNTICTDIEISSTGRLHASFGYSASVVNHRYTDDPASVTTTTGWNSSTGIRQGSAVAANRLELAVRGNLLYAVTTNASNNIDSSYRSIDGGATWTKQNATLYTTNLSNTQGWYNITLAIHPTDDNQILMGGLDAYRSTNAGLTISRATFWVSSTPYVHADHHFLQWWNIAGETRIVIGCDGGLFLSRNNGSTYRDKNRNLGIKQFYAGAIHPAAGSPYLIAGAQDNGTHQIKYPGLSSSIEVTGGDGCYVHINQLNPQIQFATYTNSQYRRSINGGQTWSSINFSSATGLFVNPFDYDDATNIMYASNGVSATPNSQIRRWLNANSTTSSTIYTIAELRRGTTNSNATAFKVSPHTPNRVFVGGSTGRLLRWDNANTGDSAAISSNIKDLTSASFPAGFLNCINVGSSDQYLVAVFTNYGVNNVWYSANGGESWSPVDGNLPDMPVRWAMFHPQYNNRLMIATETGVYSTDAVDGANTKWKIDPGFPTVKTNMLKMRTSDNTIVAATHGRGLWTSQLKLSNGAEINFAKESTPVTEQSAVVEGCRGYKDYAIDLDILMAPDANTQVTLNVQGGATARRGVDYEFTTNGNFASPSDVIEFAKGSKESRSVTLRVYDDAEVESAESFVFGFTVSGSSALAGDVDTHTVTIGDNDYAPVAVPTVQKFSVGDYNSTIATTSPFAGQRIKQRVQNLYTAAELRAAGITRAGAIKTLTLKVTEKNSTRPFTGFTISMANVPNASVSNFVAGTYTTVYSGNYTTVPGDNTFTFSTPFMWDGTSNININYCFDNGAGPVDRAADYLEGNSYPLGNGLNATTYANFTTGTTAGCSLPGAFLSTFRVNAQFGVDFGINTIATALNTTSTQYLNSQNDIYYYSSTGQVIARVKNLTPNNYACTEVKIDRAGNSATKFWNSNKKNFLMDKTYQITPATKHSSGKYEVTLYFTKQEKEGYEVATGVSWNEVLMVKVAGRISEVTASNAQPNNNGTVQAVVVPVRGTYGDGYTLTGVFENAFGGFGVGDPGRTSNNIIVKGNSNNNQRVPGNYVENTINWTTSSETNTSHFEVEHSYDGVSFRKVADVNAAGNASNESSYSIERKENSEINYYRVVMVYANKVRLVSNVIQLKQSIAGKQEMFVLNNPFTDNIRVRFARVPQSVLSVRLFDVQGRMVYSNRVSPSEAAIFRIGNGGALFSGTYLLEVEVDGRRFQAKLIKQ